jgi:hypothetical protein
VTRWRYGQKAHLESSLEALKLWDEDRPPQLETVEELETTDGYGLRLRFALGGVSFDRWQERQQRLGRFFGGGLRSDLIADGPEHLLLSLLPDAAAHPDADAEESTAVPSVPAAEP